MFVMFMEAGGMSKLSKNHQHIFGFVKIMVFLTIVPGIIGFYSFYGFLFDKYLSKRKIMALCISAILVSILAGFMALIFLNLATRELLIDQKAIEQSLTMMTFMALLALIHGVIALVMKGFINWYGDIKLKEELQRGNFETELALVKSQLSPHFLFNSINSIDVLIKKDADKASAYLNKLSDIMRFMLYGTKTEKIPLQTELTYIEKYIDLQKIRTANTNFVNYTAEVEGGLWQIAPMLFIPFIENAFKHAVNKRTNNAIVIHIKATAGQLDFYCENHFSENGLENGEAGGLGNELLKKRLNLLYPQKHHLKTAKQDNIYKVDLTIYADQD
jgi:LytS/YehU family sensor histidine kinase